MDSQFHDLLDRLDHLSGQFDNLRGLIGRAVRLADNDPEMALTRVRKVLEYVVHDAYQRLVKKPPGTQPLENLLQILVKDGHLPVHLAPYTNLIRELGNVGTHRPDGNYKTQDVNISLSQLRAVLDWYFEMVRPDATAVPGLFEPPSTSVQSPHPAGRGSRAGQFRDPLAEKTVSPSPIPTPDPVAPLPPLPERRKLPWPKIVAAAMLSLLLLVTIVTVTINQGRSKIEVNAPRGAAGQDTGRPDPVAGEAGVLPTGPDRVLVGEPRASTANAPSLKKETPLSSVFGPTSSRGEFQPLFNGRDLSGWTFPMGSRSDWSVEEGVLTSSAEKARIATSRADYADFHLRVDLQVLNNLIKIIGIRSSIDSRSADLSSAYNYNIGGWNKVLKSTTRLGICSIVEYGAHPTVGLRELTPATRSPLKQQTWHKVEIIAVGNRLRMLVDDQEASAFEDPQSRLRQGRIAFPSGLRMRKIEIKEL
jgi:Domain of Unknown Function (DUF1080)/Domain of unknown function (DUF4145)